MEDNDNPTWTREQIARGRALASEKRRGRPVLDFPKQTVTIRLDHDIVDWLRQQGPGYQTRVNEILHAYMVEHR